MTINVIIHDGKPKIEGLLALDSYRIPQLRKTIERYAHLIDGTAYLTLSQLADRILKQDNGLRTMTNANYFKQLHAEMEQFGTPRAA